jgi:purine-binding chemotaxis protein CheW
MTGALHVVFTVGAADYVLPASEIAQMETYDGATPVPGSAPYVAGVIQVRGRVVPVVDLRARFGLPSVERTLDTRVVVSEHAGRTVGLIVDRARDVVMLAKEQLAPPPAMVAAQSAGFVVAVANLGPRIVMLLDVWRLIGEELSNDGD